MLTTLLAIGALGESGGVTPPAGLTVRADRIVTLTGARTWRKYPEEFVLVARDWTEDLDGAAIVGDPADPVIPAGSGLTLEFADLRDNVALYWLGGGRRGTRFKIKLAIDTDEGETLADHVAVLVLR